MPSQDPSRRATTSPPPRDRSERERRILDAARAAFHERGFHGVGVDEIGKLAGLSGPAIYRHFAGKDELLASLLNEAMDELFSALDSSADPEGDLKRTMEHHLHFALEHRQLVGLYQREGRSLAEPWGRSFAQRVGAYNRRWESLVSRALPSASPEQVAIATQAVLGLVFSLPGWPDRTRRIAHVEDYTAEIILHGLGRCMSGPS